MITVRDLISWASAFSIGTALYCAFLAIRMVRSNPRRYLSFTAAEVGYAMVVGLVLLRIILPAAAEDLPLTTDTVVYLSGLVLAGLGFLGISRVIRLEFVEWESKRDGA